MPNQNLSCRRGGSHASAWMGPGDPTLWLWLGAGEGGALHTRSASQTRVWAASGHLPSRGANAKVHPKARVSSRWSLHGDLTHRKEQSLNVV